MMSFDRPSDLLFDIDSDSLACCEASHWGCLRLHLLEASVRVSRLKRELKTRVIH